MNATIFRQDAERPSVMRTRFLTASNRWQSGRVARSRTTRRPGAVIAWSHGIGRTCAAIALVCLATTGSLAAIYGPPRSINDNLDVDTVVQNHWAGRFTNRTLGNVNDFHMKLFDFRGAISNISPSSGVLQQTGPTTQTIDWVFPTIPPGGSFDVSFDEEQSLFRLYDPSQPTTPDPDPEICANWTLDGQAVGNAGLIEPSWYTGPIDPVPGMPIGPFPVRLLLEYSPDCPIILGPGHDGSIYTQYSLLQRSEMDVPWEDLDLSDSSELRNDPNLIVGPVTTMQPGEFIEADTSSFEYTSTDLDAPDGFLVLVDIWAPDASGGRGELISSFANAIQVAQAIPEPTTASLLALGAMLPFLRKRS